MPVQEKAKEMREGFSEAGLRREKLRNRATKGANLIIWRVQKRRCETDANLKICHYKTLLVRAMALLVAWFAGAVELDVCEVRRRMRYGYC